MQTSGPPSWRLHDETWALLISFITAHWHFSDVFLITLIDSLGPRCVQDGRAAEGLTLRISDPVTFSNTELKCKRRPKGKWWYRCHLDPLPIYEPLEVNMSFFFLLYIFYHWSGGDKYDVFTNHSLDLSTSTLLNRRSRVSLWLGGKCKVKQMDSI